MCTKEEKEHLQNIIVNLSVDFHKIVKNKEKLLRISEKVDELQQEVYLL